MGIDGLMVSLVKYGQKGPLFRKIKKRSNFSNFFMILLCSMARINQFSLKNLNLVMNQVCHSFENRFFQISFDFWGIKPILKFKIFAYQMQIFL